MSRVSYAGSVALSCDCQRALDRANRRGEDVLVVVVSCLTLRACPGWVPRWEPCQAGNRAALTASATASRVAGLRKARGCLATRCSQRDDAYPLIFSNSLGCASFIRENGNLSVGRACSYETIIAGFPGNACFAFGSCESCSLTTTTSQPNVSFKNRMLSCKN